MKTLPSNSRAPVDDVIEVANPSKLATTVLRERAAQAKQPHSRQFVALENGTEAGYLSLDHRSDISTGIIYDLLVLPENRLRGVGARLLAFGEEIVASLGCYRIRLHPNAFDRSVDQSWLESWYSRRGYVWASDGTREMEKMLAKETA
jgi:GNAT superfamily N-acetyltransferase